MDGNMYKKRRRAQLMGQEICGYGDYHNYHHDFKHFKNLQTPSATQIANIKKYFTKKKNKTR
jgi:hypothetical protein